MIAPMDLIERDSILYRKQLEACGNGMYSEVEVAYKTDIDSMVSAITINNDITKVVVYGEEYTPVVRCKDCIHQEHCHETVAHTRHYDGFIEHWSETIEWCSRGERKGCDTE